MKREMLKHNGTHMLVCKKARALLLTSLPFCAILTKVYTNGPSQRLCQNNEGFKQQNLYLTVLETWKPKVKVPADWLPGEGSLPAASHRLLTGLPSLLSRERHRAL